ncbi:MAG: DUF2914 domain-containing protein [Candidatus Harrisonbacteria bacterium]|nr:DUF2914 domain-containing protein [Candidatus Harrisonbacteria bacterium]
MITTRLRFYWNKVKDFFERYEHRLGFAFLVGGFIFDSLTLRRVDFLLDNLILLFYLVVAAVCILLQNLRFTVSKFTPFALQFIFGALFSGFIVFYSRSASLLTNWPFMLMLAIFFIGNEFFRRRYEQLNFNLAVFFIAIFSYLIFSIPVVLNKIGPEIFLLSGVISLFAFAAMFRLLKRVAPERILSHRKLILGTVASIFIVFNIFYFTNIIPPIPLALKDIGIYHGIRRAPGNAYLVTKEQRPWYAIFSGNELHVADGSPIYGFSSVFAPTDLETEIFHRWSYYNEDRRTWIETGKIGFSIIGGRDQGYRGYTFIRNIQPGKWRLDVITDRGQIIGRISFDVIKVNNLPVLEEVEI